MISDYMRLRLADWPEMAAATSVLKGGKQIIMIGDREVAVGPFASDTEIEVALRLAFSRPKVTTTMPEIENGNGATEQLETEANATATVQVDQSADASASTPLPPRPALAPASAVASAPARRPAPGGFGASLRAMLDEARNNLDRAQSQGKQRVQDAVSKLYDAAVKTNVISETIAQQIEDSADAALSDLGQISNEL